MRQQHYRYLFGVLTVLYLALVMLLPTDPHVLARYHLTQVSARLLSAAVAIPLVVIWLAAFYGFDTIRRYAASVADGAEGRPFDLLTKGLMISVMGLPLSSIIAAALNYVSLRHAAWLPATTVLRNYMSVGLALAAFFLIGKGAEQLARLVKKRTQTLNHQAWTIGFIMLSSLFSWLVISHYAPHGTRDPVYYMPDWLVVLTIVIPYLYVWYRGAMAAYCIYFYQKNVRGILYKQALASFSAGLAVVIATSVFIQFLVTFTERLNKLHLTPILAIIYVLLLLYALGYGFIAKGAKKLKTLEEV